MKKKLVTFALALVCCFAAKASADTAPIEYERWFTNEVLRVDLVHTGTKAKEWFGIDELVVEPLWPGPRANLVDPTGYGKYRFRVLDQATDTLLFSKGYCSLFGEWVTTEEADAGMVRSMPEPLRLPLPRAPIIIGLDMREGNGGPFRELTRFAVDPNAYDLRREQTYSFEVIALHDPKRPMSETVDIVIVPDGYTALDTPKLLADATRFTAALFGQPVFERHKGEIAVRLVAALSRESGTDEPRKGIFRDTIVDTTFDTFRSPRYLTTANLKALAEVASLAPYDTIMVLVNTSRYGGGGIYGAYSIFPSDNEYDEYVMVHELGHGFGGLGDEYFTSSTSYDEDAFYTKGVDPWEPNLSAVTDPSKLKWRQWLTPGVPLPTPDTAAYDGVVGLFEGAGYKAKGLYRPTRNSKMFHKGRLPYGPVNEAAIERMIRYTTGQPVAP